MRALLNKSEGSLKIIRKAKMKNEHQAEQEFPAKIH